MSCMSGHNNIEWDCSFCMARLRYVINKESK